jgi:hypothetical protein
MLNVSAQTVDELRTRCTDGENGGEIDCIQELQGGEVIESYMLTLGKALLLLSFAIVQLITLLLLLSGEYGNTP